MRRFPLSLSGAGSESDEEMDRTFANIRKEDEWWSELNTENDQGHGLRQHENHRAEATSIETELNQQWPINYGNQAVLEIKSWNQDLCIKFMELIFYIFFYRTFSCAF